MLNELLAAYQAAKTSVEMLRGALGMKISHEVSMAVLDVNARLLDLMSVAQHLQGEVTRLAQALDEAAQRERLHKEADAQRHEFEAEKHEYRLRQVAPGAHAYTKTSVGDVSGGIHQGDQWFCAQCFEEKRKSILQYAGHEAGDRLFKCSRCSSTVRIKVESAGTTIEATGRGRRMF